ncbi:MAG: hypothetical protein JXA20_09810 [Spirochaetes bacterium]|nr:hypothetical protein [Spirochaetota bacterium]
MNSSETTTAGSVSKVKLNNRIQTAFLSILILFPPLVIYRCMAFMTLSDHYRQSCSIVTMSDGHHAFFSNNEDNSDTRGGRIWFKPAAERRHGYALFGYRVMNIGDIPIGGINDQGLVFDMNAVPEAPLRQGSGNQLIQGSFFNEILETAATVGDVEAWVRGKDLPLLTTQQAHWADRHGDAIVLGIDPKGDLHVTRKTGNHLISVNWNRAFHEDAPGRNDDWRYDKAAGSIPSKGAISAARAAGVLEAVRLPGTVYSYVVELETGRTDLYHAGDFSRKVILDMTAEIAKGRHEYDIARLFAGQTHGHYEIFQLIPTLFAIIIVLALTGWKAFREKRKVFTKIVIALAGGILFAALGFFVRIPIQVVPIPNLVTVTIYISFAGAMVFIVGALCRPTDALSVSFLGLLLGSTVFYHISGSPDGILIRLCLPLLMYGTASIVVVSTVKKGLWKSMLYGFCTMVLAPLPLLYLYYGILLPSGRYVPMYAMVLSSINLISIPVTYIVILLAKKAGVQSAQESITPKNSLHMVGP